MPARERPTAKQQSYLRSLAERTGTTFTSPKTRRDASAEIKRLKGLQRCAGHELAGARDAVQGAPGAAPRGCAITKSKGMGQPPPGAPGRASGEGS